MKRRKFIDRSSKAVLTASLSATSLLKCGASSSENPNNMTVQEIINIILKQIPGDTSGQTVDTIKIGDPHQEVKGIVSTFLATCEVIEKTIALGANLIITHEPTFYNHRDETDWLQTDPVYNRKKQMLLENNIVVWRFHDFWHQHRPDGILSGFLEELGWSNYLHPDLENACNIPETSLSSLAATIKTTFELTRTFYIGPSDLACTKVGILPGAWGGRAHIPFLAKDIDVLIVGESQEWEAVEYVRDAAHLFKNKGLIIMGHARSEEPGMRYLVDWLRPMVPDIQIDFIPSGDPLIPV